MLSIENQPDPPSSYKISGLKSDDQRASDDTLALDEADLLKTGLPTFSIRDYALTSRRKGIERNWPFPQQYLKHCLKHGVRDILPPFEPPDLVRKRTSGKSTVESGELVCVNGKKSIVDVDSLEQEKVVLNCVLNRSCLPIENSNFDPSDQAHSSVQVQEKLALGLTGRYLCSLSRSPGLEEYGKEVTSTVNSSGQSKRKRISFNRLPCSGDSGTSSSKILKEVEVSAAPTVLQKIRNTIESPTKKCRLIEKLGNLSDPSCGEDIVASTTTISEPMSSKVCPVCKTFLSTSNTTLNAHIDQCLAMESTSKWAVNSELSKIKVKPRKKRLMVDIYATAPRCTLEELDRRNGTNWATDSSLPTTDAGVCAEGKRQRLSQEFPEDASDDNAVYFDSNGKKLRILSKLDGASVARVGEDFGPRKHANENRESNICFPGMARDLGLKEKPPKVKHQSRKLCSLQPDRPEIYEAPKGPKYGLDEKCDKDESLSEILKARDQLNPGELRQWVCSKRTGLSKKFNGKDGRRDPGYSSIMSSDLLIENRQTNFSNSSRETGSTVKVPGPIQNSSPSPTSRRKEKLSVGLRITDKGERSHKPPVCHLNRFNDGRTSASVGSVLKFSSSSRNHAASPRNNRIEICTGLTKSSNELSKKLVNTSETGHHFSRKSKKLSHLRKNLLLAGPSSPKSKSTEKKRCTILRNPDMHRSIAETREWVREVIFDVDQEYAQMSDSTKNHSDSSDSSDSSDRSDSSESLMRHEELYDEVSFGRNDLLESGNGRREQTLGRVEVEPRALESLKSGAEEIPVNGKGSIIKPSARIPVIRPSATFISELHEKDSPSNTRPNCFESVEYERTLYRTEAQMGSAEQSFSDDQEPGSAKEVGHGNRVGGNSFSETGYTECGTEPISIPGPPGSFLPSPGDISSEIVVENSLTSKRLPSSQDQYFLVDRDSSGSPVSATSTISQSQTSRFDSKYVESTSFAGARADLEKFVSGFSDSNTKLSIEEMERISFYGDTLKATAISAPEASQRFSDDHPCHCSRKETIPWSSSLTYQDIPRQQSLTPAILPSVGNQMNYNQKVWPEVFTTSSGCPSSIINEKVPMMDLSRSSVTSTGSPDTASKYPGHDNYGSTSSSSQGWHHSQPTSNPVLRLMGKNLMIVNTDEDASVELKVVPPVAPNDGHANVKYPTLQGLSIGNVSTENHVSFYHVIPDAPVLFSHAPSNPSRVGTHNNIYFGDFIGASLPQNGLKDRSDLQTIQERPIDRSSSQFYNVHRGDFAASQHQQQYPCFSQVAAPNSSREVIVIDDCPESEANLSMKYTQGSIGKLHSPVGVLPSPTLDPSSRQVNPFYCYPSQNSYTARNTPVSPYPVMCPRGTNSQVKHGDSLYAFMPKQH